jgi:hypothetical protein
VPEALCDVNSSFTLKQYIQRCPKSDQLSFNVGSSSAIRRLGVSVDILNELIPCLQLNYDSISNCLVLLSILSIDHRSGIYIHQLFDALSAIVDKVDESDWIIIAVEWSRKYCDILEEMIISNPSIQFLDGCKHSKNERLIKWAQANTLKLLNALNGVENNLNIDILNPVNLQMVDEIVKTSLFFTRKTKSYEKTLLAIGLLRHQLTSFAILENKVTKVNLYFNLRKRPDQLQTP